MWQKTVARKIVMVYLLLKYLRRSLEQRRFDSWKIFWMIKHLFQMRPGIFSTIAKSTQCCFWPPFSYEDSCFLLGLDPVPAHATQCGGHQQMQGSRMSGGYLKSQFILSFSDRSRHPDSQTDPPCLLKRSKICCQAGNFRGQWKDANSPKKRRRRMTAKKEKSRRLEMPEME